MIDFSKIDIPDPKPPTKGRIYHNVDDDKLYVWTGKRWICVEDDV